MCALPPRRRSRLGCLCSLRKTKQARDLTLFACIEAVEEHANIAFVDPAREERSMAHEARAGSIEEHEMVERDERAATAFSRNLAGSNPYPRHTAVDAM